jgi:hypothetical protein
MAKKKKTTKETKKKIRTKEVWLQSLEDIATDSSRDPHARLGALRQIGDMMGFKDSHNFEKLGTEERLKMVKTVVVPVLQTVFDIEIDEDKDISIM